MYFFLFVILTILIICPFFIFIFHNFTRKINGIILLILSVILLLVGIILVPKVIGIALIFSSIYLIIIGLSLVIKNNIQTFNITGLLIVGIALLFGYITSSVIHDNHNITWAWGSNNVGALGTGKSISFSSTPIKIDSLSNISKASSGNSYTLALEQATIPSSYIVIVIVAILLFLIGSILTFI